MIKTIKKFLGKRSIKFSFVGKYGLEIKSNLNDDQLQEFIYMLYSNTLINDVMNNIKVNNEEQYIRVTKNLQELAAKIADTNIDENQPIVGVVSENNNMGRS